MIWLDSITDSTDRNMSKLQEIVKDRGAWHAAVRGVTKSQTQLRDWSNWTEYQEKLKLCTMESEAEMMFLV